MRSDDPATVVINAAVLSLIVIILIASLRGTLLAGAVIAHRVVDGASGDAMERQAVVTPIQAEAAERKHSTVAEPLSDSDGGSNPTPRWRAALGRWINGWFRATEEYVVKHGDTLSDIAARHGLQLNELLKLGENHQDFKNPDLLVPGQTVRVPRQKE